MTVQGLPDGNGGMENTPTVLIVDDDAVTRMLVRGGLTRIGLYRVLEAPNGAAAQEILRSEDVDVVITDLLMPGLSGLDLIRWANGEKITPVWIILSGMDTFDAAVDAIQVGAFDFLVKPPGLPALEVSVRNALEYRRLLEERDRLFAQLEAESAVIRRDLERAEVIQRALLPARPPQLDSYRVHALYCAGNHVGGDLYNVIRIGRYLVFYVADATGHGVSSAMLSVLFNRRLVIRGDTGEPLSPATVLERVNHALCAERVGAGLFLTTAYCVLDLDTGRARLAAAGHPPAVWRRASGELHKITRTGPVLGLTAQAQYGEVSIQFAEGDRLLLFTDGLMQYNEPEQWRIIEQAVGRLDADGSEVLEELMASVQHAGDDRDDMTLLMLQASPGVSAFSNVANGKAATAIVAARPSTIWYGEQGEVSVLQVRGRGTWLDGDAFYDTAKAIADEGKQVVIDLSLCDYLDSTLLGTIHELVSGGRVRVQSLMPPVKATFEELDMKQVLDSAQEPPIAVPEDMQPLSNVAGATANSQQRILRAHETLSSLSERNREKFSGVVEAMKGQAS